MKKFKGSCWEESFSLPSTVFIVPVLGDGNESSSLQYFQAIYLNFDFSLVH